MICWSVVHPATWPESSCFAGRSDSVESQQHDDRSGEQRAARKTTGRAEHFRHGMTPEQQKALSRRSFESKKPAMAGLFPNT
jgi:hypothetical protein